jgi:alpha-tubulin suppressor-like RCC1 family protein
LDTCALLTEGTVKCWGANLAGELGDGTTTDRYTPVSVSGLSGVSAISAGADHTCALLSGGTVKCWGWNYSGQLGDGTTTDRYTPVSVSGLSGVSAISAGYYHTCALLSGGTVKCWGRNNDYGQLGDGTNTNRLTPVSVSGLSGVSQIDAGGVHTCALLTEGTVKCWGANLGGQLGDGTNTTSNTPVSVSGLSGVSQIAAGAETVISGVEHTCALLSGGTVKCWGDSEYGQLGNGTTTDSNTPVSVSGLSGVSQIAAGRDHTCALLSGGTLKCWGDNFLGGLGDGTNTDRLTPVSVVGF